MATVTLTPGTLLQPACYPTEQARFEAYVAAIQAAISGGIQWDAAPGAPGDVGLYWLRLDGVNGRALEPLKYSTPDGAWARWLSSLHNAGAAGGSSNAYTYTQSPAAPSAEAYRLGATYVFKATFANTGPATLSVDGNAALAITKRGIPLEAGDITVGMVAVVVHDGASFQLITPPAVRQTRFGYLYTEGNTTASPLSAPPGDIVLSVTKPSNATWQEFDLNACLAWRASTENVEVECDMTFETAPLTAADVTTKSGCGNSKQQMLGAGVDNDSNNAFWRRMGPIPTEWASVNTISFKIHMDVKEGSFQEPSTLYAFLRCSYTEPVP